MNQKFPPSLSRVRSPLKSTGYRERQTEREKKAKARVAAVKEAMMHLPLKPGAEAEMRKMSSLFEQTHYAASQQIEDRAATTRTMKDELNALAKGLNKVADHVESMHPDTLRAWAGGADAATNEASLLLILRTAEDWAGLSVTTLNQARRVGGRGRTEDLKAKWMRETAAFVYKRLTDRKDNIAYDAYAGQERETEFSASLQRIFKIYGLKASAKSRARKR